MTRNHTPLHITVKQKAPMKKSSHRHFHLKPHHYFFFKMLFTTRMLDTSLLVEVNTSTFHTCDERPR